MRYNPFNPQMPARPDFFVGREPEIVEFEKFLLQTTHHSPMNMSITGNRGMGKTSILAKFEEIGKKHNCLVLRISNYEGNVNDIVDFTDYLTSNLKREILSRKPIAENVDKLWGWLKQLRPTIKWNDVDFSFEQKQLVQEVLRARLKKIWEQINSDYPAVVILIDEAEALEKIEGILAFLREVLQRLSPDANYIFVLAGKLNFPERMSESFSPLNRFFPCQKLAPLKRDEIEEYVKKKLQSEQVGINKDSLDYLFRESEGHPYVLVAMCYLIFDSLNANENTISIDVINRSKAKVKAKLADDFFAPMYHPLTPKAKEYLKMIAKHAHGTIFSFGDVVEWTGEESSYISPYVQELLRKGILNKPERGRYELFHRLFLEYVQDVTK